tara:strand:- start:343 stop:690 length:348 start_codon:yes stop_codon:yes gene_type:complete
MEQLRSLKFIQSELYHKYERMLNGVSYTLIFTKTDGYLLYNETTNIGLEFTYEHRNKVYHEVLKSKGIWYKGDNQDPNQHQVNVETKHRLFKNWIEGHVKKQSDIKEVLQELIKT